MADIKAIEAVLEKIDNEPEILVVNGKEEAGYDLGEFIWDLSSRELEVDGITFRYEQGKLGEEGGGENIWFVFSAREDASAEPQELFRVQGFYSSYEGSEWDPSSVHPVVAEEYTAIRYVAVK